MINDEIKEQVKVRFQVIGSIIVDGLFLFVWLIVTLLLSYFTDKVVAEFEISSLDEKMFRIFQWLFNGSTFITIVSFLVQDIWTIFLKTRSKIHKTSKKYK